MGNQNMALSGLVNDYLTNKNEFTINALVTATSRMANFYSGCLNADSTVAMEVSKKAYLDLFKNMNSLENLDAFDSFFKTFIRKQTVALNDDFYSFDQSGYESGSYAYGERDLSDGTVSGNRNMESDISIALEGLNPVERMVSVMRYSDGLGMNEISSELGLNEKVISGILHAAEEKISMNIDSLKSQGLSAQGDNISCFADMFRHCLEQPAVSTTADPLPENTIKAVPMNQQQPVQQVSIPVSKPKASGLLKVLAAVAALVLFMIVADWTGLISIYKNHYNPVYYHKMIQTNYDSDDEISNTYEVVRNRNNRTVSSIYDYDSFYYKYSYKYDTEGNTIRYQYENTDYDAYGDNRYVYVDGKQVKTISYDEDGDVKTVTTYRRTYRPDGKLSSFREYADGELVSETRYKYNYRGYLVSQEVLDEDGDVVRMSEYEYDRNGNRILEKSFSEDEDYYYSYYEYEYDRNNQMTESRNYDSDGELSSISYYKDGLRTLYESYYSGKLSSYTEYQYNRNGLLILSENYDSSDNLNSYTEYEYDFRGRETYRCTYSSNDDVRYYTETQYR